MKKKFKNFYKKVCKNKNFAYLCTRNTTTGCSAVRLAHLVWDQRVPGSNPGTPTERKIFSSSFFVNYGVLAYKMIVPPQGLDCATCRCAVVCSFRLHPPNLPEREAHSGFSPEGIKQKIRWKTIGPFVVPPQGV